MKTVLHLIFGALFLAPALAAAAATPYGMAAHLSRMSQPEMIRELEGTLKSGYGFIRFDADWGAIEREPGKWDYSRLDPAIDACVKRGAEVLLILPGTIPSHARPPFRNRDKWRKFVERTVLRYKGKVRYYEIFNEVDCAGPWGDTPSAENYTELLRETYAQIKKIDPDSTVLFSGLSDFNDPFPFWERAFRAGAGGSFDGINMHPYQMKNFPESRLIRQIARLRALMKEYRIDVPIWITEFGNSTSPFREGFTRAVVEAGLKKLGFKPETLKYAVIVDDEMMFYTDGVNLRTSDYMPAGATRCEVSFAGLETLSPDECPVLALPGSEEFPGVKLPSILNWLRRGGTVILPNSLPFYFDLVQREDGYFDRIQVNKKYIEPFHIDWFAFWTRPGTPQLLRKIVPAPEFPDLKIRQVDSIRFISNANCRGNDRMIPLVYAQAEGGFQAPIAALFCFDSDLKGNFLWLTNNQGSVSCSESLQAALFVRHYLVALGCGVQHVFYYRYRAGENDKGPEAHYGILHQDFSPKPAAVAAAELTRRNPPGGTPVKLERIGRGAFRADWKRPDGTSVCAVWAIGHPVQLKWSGRKIDKAISHLGKAVPVPESSFTIDIAPVYLESLPGETGELFLAEVK